MANTDLFDSSVETNGNATSASKQPAEKAAGGKAGASKKTERKRAPRDASKAQAIAQNMVEQAKAASAAVAAYHEAVDVIDEAQKQMAAAKEARLNAVVAMREAGLRIAQISELTGLSEARIYSLIRS